MMQYSFLQKVLLTTTFVFSAFFFLFAIVIVKEHNPNKGNVLGISASDNMVRTYDSDFHVISEKLLNKNEIINSAKEIRHVSLNNNTAIISKSAVYDLTSNADINAYSGYIFIDAKDDINVFMAGTKIKIFGNSQVIVNANQYEVIVLEGYVTEKENIIAEKGQVLKWLVDIYGIRPINFKKLEQNTEINTLAQFLYNLNIVPQILEPLTPLRIIN